MSELARRGGHDRSGGDRLAQIDNEQRQIFVDLLTSITAQGDPLLSKRNRRKLAWRETTIGKPLLDRNGQFSNLMHVDFMIVDGTTISLRNIPTAIAYGQVAHEPNLMLVGGAHYPSTLAQNGIDPKKIDRFTAMLGEFPGHFLTPTDYFAFCIAPTPTGDIGVLVGDSDPTNRKGLLVAKERFINPATKQEALAEINDFLGNNLAGKFLVGGE